jgi:hypothetical protein
MPTSRAVGRKWVSALWVTVGAYLLVNEAVETPGPTLFPEFFWNYSLYVFVGSTIAIVSGALAWHGYWLGQFGLVLLAFYLMLQQLSHIYYYGPDYDWPQFSSKLLFALGCVASTYVVTRRAT